MDRHRPSPTTPPVAPDVLTPRQREVAALIVEGLTNAELAKRLAITPGTVANHVEAILRRLGCHTRTQAAVWAVTHGLVVAAPPSAADGAADGMAAATF